MPRERRRVLARFTQWYRAWVLARKERRGLDTELAVKFGAGDWS